MKYKEGSYVKSVYLFCVVVDWVSSALFIILIKCPQRQNEQVGFLFELMFKFECDATIRKL